MQLDAAYTADIEVSAPVGTGTASGVFSGSFTVRNLGPSDESNVGVDFGAFTSHLQHTANQGIFLKVSSPTSGQTPDCQYFRGAYSGAVSYQTTYTGYSAYCSIGPLRAGQSVTVGVLFHYQVPPTGGFYEDWPIQWGAQGDLHDLNQANNGGSRLSYACRNDPTSPNPKCKESIPAPATEP
jgi:hypothetical protein